MREPLVPKSDNRGTLYEVIKTPGFGQIFFSTSLPGVVRGNHYHTRKTEKLCVIKGTGKINIRDRTSGQKTTVEVSGNKPEVVTMPLNSTHNIINTGHDEMLLLVWANEVFDPKDPDTFPEKV
ncbi:MAG: WxcM-like domain-containing protein [bacterium]